MYKEEKKIRQEDTASNNKLSKTLVKTAIVLRQNIWNNLTYENMKYITTYKKFNQEKQLRIICLDQYGKSSIKYEHSNEKNNIKH